MPFPGPFRATILAMAPLEVHPGPDAAFRSRFLFPPPASPFYPGGPPIRREDEVTNFILGMNTCFAVKRWPEPEEWARIVAEEFGLKTVQFSFDLMDPRQGSGVVASYIDHTRIACSRQGITIHSTFTGFLPFMQNLLLHPEPAFRDDAKAWFKAAIEVTARMKVAHFGGYFGALSMKDVTEANRRQERMDAWLDALRELAQEAKDKGLES